MKVKAKKHLGQHFLINKKISEQIVESLDLNKNLHIIEIGPGQGALTQFLIKKTNQIILIEIDQECIEVLKNKFQKTKIIYEDILKIDLDILKIDSYSIIGNFPYNISSQILFKVLEHRNNIHQVVGMFQKEVADRICSKPKSKKYGILSVLMQAYFNCTQLLDVYPEDFRPKPKVNSSVIKLTRNNTAKLKCDHKQLTEVVKLAFGQRRKTLKNALKKITNLEELNLTKIMNSRAEELTVSQFIELTIQIFKDKTR
ncbi:MAG: 16S rRNA (adenine(1518)-N(6)/adenine(1519)-N(6))-dimethyltransferase [Flavobacteriales bacterium]|nr:16S rRNA (adenine(1518)-N(6)/adenine(1519)-N(6))-dimethyltransferase [Flavobacteriales bacterium]|tara:strand:- start:61 stop:831 length:771 start_codon:yes stop_codon:yes gene_type:complete